MVINVESSSECGWIEFLLLRSVQIPGLSNLISGNCLVRSSTFSFHPLPSSYNILVFKSHHMLCIEYFIMATTIKETQDSLKTYLSELESIYVSMKAGAFKCHLIGSINKERTRGLTSMISLIR